MPNPKRALLRVRAKKRPASPLKKGSVQRKAPMRRSRQRNSPRKRRSFQRRKALRPGTSPPLKAAVN
jgi:hypothetical protein